MSTPRNNGSLLSFKERNVQAGRGWKLLELVDTLSNGAGALKAAAHTLLVCVTVTLSSGGTTTSAKNKMILNPNKCIEVLHKLITQTPHIPVRHLDNMRPVAVEYAHTDLLCGKYFFLSLPYESHFRPFMLQNTFCLYVNSQCTTENVWFLSCML